MTWTIEGSIEGGDLDVFAVDKTLGNYRVCMVDCNNDSVSNHDHMTNARLIAAAPDLLQALHDADEFCQQGLNSAEPPHWEAALQDIMGLVRNAITKATGA